jgi:predicted nuclease with TOPRIM domain
MQAKKIVFSFSVLILFFGLICSADASSDIAVSFRGDGVTIDLAFPAEAHPLDSINHTLTIITNTDMVFQNFTVSIEAPVNSGWQEIRKREEIGQSLSKNTPWMVPLSMSLPQDSNGTLRCFIYALTNQTTEPLSYTFYTTEVREMTYSELLAGYNILNNTYNQLEADYNTLNNTYNDLQTSFASLNILYDDLEGNRSILKDSYDDLLIQNTTLTNKYNTLETDYNNEKASHSLLLQDYTELQEGYDLLNSTFYTVQGNYNNLKVNLTDLQDFFDELNQTYAELLNDRNNLQNAVDIDRVTMFIFTLGVAALVFFIIYLKRKKQEPYVVIRKETVSMKSDEKS